MKLIKLNTDHYIIVDDSEIKEGDYIINIQRMHIYPTPVCADDVEYRNRRNDVFKKITHSTQPESLGMGWMQSVLPLLLSEVKELIGEVDVVELSKKTTKHQKFANGLHEEVVAQMFYRKGYNQALEDNKEKKYTEEIFDTIIQVVGSNKVTTIRDFLLKHIQPKTEWEVEFVDGKLKLK